MATRITVAQLAEQNNALTAQIAAMQQMLESLVNQPKADPVVETKPAAKKTKSSSAKPATKAKTSPKAKNDGFLKARREAIASRAAHDAKAVVLDLEAKLPSLKALQAALAKPETGCGQLQIPSAATFTNGRTLRVNRCEKPNCSCSGISDADRYATLKRRFEAATK